MNTTTTMTTAGIGMTTAMRTLQTTLEASTSHTSQLDTSDKQTHDYTSTNPNHYLAREQHTTSWNDHSKSFQQFLQEDNTQPHFDIAAARQQQRNKKIENTITHYIMYSNFKSYHHLLIDSGASTHVCPKDYAPDLPLRPCGESVPQLYTVTNKKIPVYGIKYVPYKQDNFRIMIPYYVCDVKYPILSASRLLDRGYGLDFTPRHCTITHGQQQAHLIRHSGLFYLRAEKIDIPTGFDIYPMTTDSGKSIAVIQPTERAAQQQEQIAPLTHTDQGLRPILGGNTDYWKLDGDYAISTQTTTQSTIHTTQQWLPNT